MLIYRYIIAFMSLFFLSAASYALETTFSINNNTSSSKTLIGGQNTTGTLTPGLPPSIPGNTSTGPHVSFTSGDLVDAGVVRYSSCRFNWSIIKTGSIYTFSKGASPSSKCSVSVLLQNAFTGEYSLEFDID